MKKAFSSGIWHGADVSDRSLSWAIEDLDLDARLRGAARVLALAAPDNAAVLCRRRLRVVVLLLPANRFEMAFLVAVAALLALGRTRTGVVSVATVTTFGHVVFASRS